MNIKFAGITVCSGVKTDSPIKFAYEGDEDEQVSKFMRAVSAVVFPRGNETSVITFTGFKTHGSIQAAEAYVLNFRQANFLPKYGTLVLTTDDGSHTNGTAMYMAKAHFKKGKAAYDGINTYCDFTFTGGALTSSKP